MADKGGMGDVSLDVMVGMRGAHLRGKPDRGGCTPSGRTRRALALARIASACVVLLLASCGGSDAGPEPGAAQARRVSLEVVRSVPHQVDAFTQGLLLFEGRLFESTGLRGQSTLREVDLDSGQVVRSVDLPSELFGEGLARVGDRLFQLTWTSGVARVHRVSDFGLIQEHRYPTQGWGLCHDGSRLVMSDGTSTLYFRDVDTFAELGRVSVTLDGRSRDRLNELECVGGRVWANVFQTDEIVEIDPANGVVTSVLDASGLLTPAERASSDVLNGIAYRPDTDTFFLTGKLWPRLFEVRLLPQPKRG